MWKKNSSWLDHMMCRQLQAFKPSCLPNGLHISTVSWRDLVATQNAAMMEMTLHPPSKYTQLSKKSSQAAVKAQYALYTR